MEISEIIFITFYKYKVVKKHRSHKKIRINTLAVKDCFIKEYFW